MNDKLIKVGITQGDINGIGYELILKTLEEARIFEFCIPVIYGSSKIWAYHRKNLEFSPVNVNNITCARDASTNRFNIVNCGNEELMVELSRQTPEAAAAAKAAVQKAMEDLNAGHIRVLLTAPAVEDFTPLLVSEVGKGKQALQLFVKDSFRVALATDKAPLSKVSALLTPEKLTEKIKALHDSLIHDFTVTSPRIAVLALNPATGEKEFGKEETESIIPALAAASEAGVCCFGPYQADKFFSSEEYMKFDAVLAMYYDQALIPFRSIAYGEGVCYLAGLPAIVTAPEQGVSYELAGKNKSSENSFRNALYLAIDIFKNRAFDKEIYANPLKKQYFERGSDNEKLDLTKDEV